LLPALNARLSTPSLLVDIGGLTELRGVSLVGDRLRIGAVTRHADIARDPLVARHAPLLALAAPFIAHPAIRNRGTIGGSLALADPAAEWPACVTALDAQIVIASAGGERRVPARDFFQGVYTVDLGADEIIVAIEIPVARDGDRVAFDEIAMRRGDFAFVGIAMLWRAAPGGLLRLVYLGVADRPTCVEFASSDVIARAAAGRIDELVAEAVAKLDPPHDPYASASYRLHLARVLTGRMVRPLIEGRT
jgi:carbon-monoxide dehydrogenase medium subunit